MIEASIDSIRVSLMSQHRVVVLKEAGLDRYLAIWIGPDTAEAIHMHLQHVAVARPMTHDLMIQLIKGINASVSHIVISDLSNDVFYARIVLDIEGKSIEIDSRPSDALAIAVRANAKIFINDEVMDTAGIEPEVNIDLDFGEASGEDDKKEASAGGEDLDVFRDFVDSLDLDDLNKKE